jgi:hypothetical protein
MLDKLQKWLDAGKDVLLACELKAVVIKEELIKMLEKLKDVEKAPVAAPKKKKAKSKA